MSQEIKLSILPPQDRSVQENLRFYCQTCEHDDPSLPFMVNMWSYSLSQGCLSGRQAKSAIKYINYRLKQLGLEEVLKDEQ